MVVASEAAIARLVMMMKLYKCAWMYGCMCVCVFVCVYVCLHVSYDGKNIFSLLSIEWRWQSVVKTLPKLPWFELLDKAGWCWSRKHVVAPVCSGGCCANRTAAGGANKWRRRRSINYILYESEHHIGLRAHYRITAKHTHTHTNTHTNTHQSI